MDRSEYAIHYGIDYAIGHITDTGPVDVRIHELHLIEADISLPVLISKWKLEADLEASVYLLLEQFLSPPPRLLQWPHARANLKEKLAGKPQDCRDNGLDISAQLKARRR